MTECQFKGVILSENIFLFWIISLSLLIVKAYQKYFIKETLYLSPCAKNRPIKKIKHQVMDIRRPVFLKLWPRILAVISDKYLALIPDKYVAVIFNKYLAVISNKYGADISNRRRPNNQFFFFFRATIFLPFLSQKKIIFTTNVLWLLFPKHIL